MHNEPSFILDGQNYHVMINIVHKVRGARLDLITIPLHTSHAL